MLLCSVLAVKVVLDQGKKRSGAKKKKKHSLKSVAHRSMVNWGYRDNFKPVYLFIYLSFYEKILSRKTLTSKKPNNRAKKSEQKQQRQQFFVHKIF